MIALILVAMLMYAVPFILLLALPILATISLKQSGHAWRIFLLPLLVPVAALASEAFPKWRVGEIARAPLDVADRERVTSIYVPTTAEDAARLAARHPDLDFTEGVLNRVIRDVDANWQLWQRIPDGLVRFQGSRAVNGPDDCSPDEIGVTPKEWDGKTIHWFCTRWESVQRPAATHELRHTVRQDRDGPYRVDAQIDEVVRRADGRQTRSIKSASMTGGIVQQLMSAIDFWPGASDRAKYYAATLGDAGIVCQETFLLDGKNASNDATSDCRIDKMAP